MNSANLSRKERERLMRRQAMLEAARAVFAEKGYANATLEEIAQRAEFGKGTLYNYFPGGKDELFLLSLRRYLHNSRSLSMQLLRQQRLFVKALRRLYVPVLPFLRSTTKSCCWLCASRSVCC
jgi:AcrR family transcriptional regulator